MKRNELYGKYNFEIIELIPSSNIAEAFYDKENKVVMVVFRSGKSYLYFGIEPKLVENWKLADSAGKFFAEYIKWGRFEEIQEDL